MLPLISNAGDAVPVTLVSAADRAANPKRLGARTSRWADATGFKAGPGEVALVPGDDGALEGVLVGWKPEEPLWALADLPDKLPERDYALDGAPAKAATQLALGWALGAYQFTRYRRADARKDCMKDAKAAQVRARAEAKALRDSR